MTKDPTRKFFIYARKSTDTEDRQVRSIGDQISELRELAQKENVEIVDTIVEKQTAKIPGRPMFADMLKRIEAGEAVGILAWHPDRLARNSVDGGQIIYMVDTGVIQELKFPTFWFDPTPQGKFMLSIAFGQSKYYVDNLSENIKRGHRQKLKQGLWPQMAPLGYLNNRETKQIYLDKEKAPLIKKTFEAYASGNHTLKNLQKIINGLGLRGRRDGLLSVSNFQYMLQNPFYYGIIRYNGEFYNGKHEPIITKKLFDECQEAMKRKSKPQKVDGMKFFLYRGFFHCGECGFTITADRKIKPSGKSYTYYYCTKKNPNHICSQNVFTREEKISSQVKTEIQKVSLPDDWAKNMLLELDKEKEQAKKESEVFVQNLQNQKAEIEQKIENLLNLYIEGKWLTIEEYQAKKQKLLNEKLDTEQKIRDFERMGNNWLEPIREMIFEAKQAKILLSQGDNQQILTFLKNVGSNFILKDKKFNFCFKIGWRARVAGEPNASFSNWRRGRDSNPRDSLKPNTLAGCCYQPLSHLSLGIFYLRINKIKLKAKIKAF